MKTDRRKTWQCVKRKRMGNSLDRQPSSRLCLPPRSHSRIAAAVARAGTHATTGHAGADTRARTSGHRVVGAEHADPRAELGTAKRHHVLPDMGSHDLAVLRSGVGQDPLDEVVAVLVAGNVDERNTRAVVTTLADAVEVALEELRTTNLQTLLNDLRGKLVHAVLGRIADDMVDGTAAILRSTMLADVLDAPVAKLAMGDNVNVGKDLLNAGAL